MDDDISYKQLNNEFVPSLSIIDVMMFNSKEQISELLLRYTIEEGYEELPVRSVTE